MLTSYLQYTATCIGLLVSGMLYREGSLKTALASVQPMELLCLSVIFQLVAAIAS